MNQDMIEGNWKELKGSIMQKWGKLTDDDLTVINGSRIKLTGTIQKNYGCTLEEAEKQLDEWEKSRR